MVKKEVYKIKIVYTNKKSQAALEFLWTYGWAIMIVIIIIAALGYFGVLNPKMLIPETCVLDSSSGLFCKDINSIGSPDAAKNINLKLKSLLNDPINITNVTFIFKSRSAKCSMWLYIGSSGNKVGCPCGGAIPCTVSNEGLILKQETEAIMSINSTRRGTCFNGCPGCCGPPDTCPTGVWSSDDCVNKFKSGDKLDGDLYITYVPLNSMLVKKYSGSLTLSVN